MNPKYQLDTEENKAFLKTLYEELLTFGRRVASPKGGAYYLGDDGTPWTDRPRECWITCRMAHVYSMGTMMGYEGCREIAEASINGLLTELRDTEHGGFYSGVTADGGILPDKMCYAHAFVILAGSTGCLAGIKNADKLLKTAVSIYDEKFWNEAEGLSCDFWNTEFTEMSSYRGINSNMHTVEAFLALADATGENKYRIRAGRIIDHIVTWSRENNYRIPEHFDSDWKYDLDCNIDKPDDPFKPYGATCGHGIEWARLIAQWAISTYMPNPTPQQGISINEADTTPQQGFSTNEVSPAAKQGISTNEAAVPYLETAENLYNRAIADGWNADGNPGIVYTTDWEGKPVVHDRMHWTLMEAINTSAVLYRITGKQKYADDYAAFMEYMDTYVHDAMNGSFFHQLDAENKVLTTVWPGKSDLYHAFQAMRIPYLDPALSIATAIKKETTKKRP